MEPSRTSLDIAMPIDGGAAKLPSDDLSPIVPAPLHNLDGTASAAAALVDHTLQHNASGPKESEAHLKSREIVRFISADKSLEFPPGELVSFPAPSKAASFMNGFRSLLSLAVVTPTRYSEDTPMPPLRTIPLPEDQDPLHSLAMREFIAYPGKKVLLVPEAHGSKEAIFTRSNVAKGNYQAFSEGQTGSKALAGIPGFETEADVEAPIMLKTLDRYEGLDPKEMPGLPTNKESFYEICSSIGVPRAKIDHMWKDFQTTKTPEARKRVISKHQMHERDKNFARQTAIKCDELAHSRIQHIGVGFMGGTHLVEGLDDPDEDIRSTTERVPEFLVRYERAQNVGNHLIFVAGDRTAREVRVWVYPKVLQTEEERDEIRPILLAASQFQRTE